MFLPVVMTPIPMVMTFLSAVMMFAPTVQTVLPTVRMSRQFHGNKRFLTIKELQVR